MKTYTATSQFKVNGQLSDVDHTFDAKSWDEAEAICKAHGWLLVAELTGSTSDLVAMYEKAYATIH